MAGGAAILAVLVWRVGTGPLVDGLRLTTGWPIAAAFAITSLTTLCCAWRWRLVARGLGVELPLWTAVAAYYRSQFLNATLPGGVVGDVHRAVRHGREAGDLGRSLRAVAWERASGFAVQVVLTVGVLFLLPAGTFVPSVAVTAVVVAGVALIVVLLCLNRRRLSSRIGRAFTSDLRNAILAPRAWPGIVLASVVAVLGHAAVFLIAVQATGTDVSPARLLPLALVVLTASAVPTNIAGWGPREGAAAWAFSSLGLGAALGVTVAVVYGVLALVATLPGAVVLVLARRRARPIAPDSTEAPERIGSALNT
ncbi:lysylphosphatidylglycerol synthase transmembrane domain-containing protein [Kribbella sp. NPDC049584]|uniref:lysylphosphatidylglycerol synthase transmembrane domain-containing protein n=1 Tax=Kribbella sp. NPDC049584 TaxID=3154833 RepID=UPI00342B81F4